MRAIRSDLASAKKGEFMINYRSYAFAFGVVFIIVGLLGFIPAVTPNGMLLGIFHVNTAHNLVHLLSGIVAIFCSKQSIAASRMYFLVFGTIYGLVALLGFTLKDPLLFGLIANNRADAWLHLAIAITSLGLGVQGLSRPSMKHVP